MTKQIDEITLFDIDMDGSMEPSEDGQWVRTSDHFVAIEECRKATLEEVSARLMALPLPPTSFRIAVECLNEIKKLKS